MISASDLFRQQLGARIDNRNYLITIYMMFADGKRLYIHEEDIWDGSVTFSEGTSSTDSFDIGGAVIGQCKFVLNNIYEQFSEYDFFNATFTIDIGLQFADGSKEYIRKGVYTVNTAEYNGSLIALNCFDYMWKLDVPFSEISQSYNTTARQLVANICNHCGIALASQTFNNSGTTIYKPLNNGDMNCREVLSYIGQICCVYFKMSPDGTMKADWYDKSIALNQDNKDGGTYDTKTTPYSDGDALDGGNFNYGTKAQSVNISTSNVNTWFAVSNTAYFFQGSGSTWTNTNKNIHNSEAKTVFTARQNGTVTFTYRCDSEKTFDKLIINYNNTELVNVSGENQVGSVTKFVEAGDTLTFTYRKDSSTSGYTDTASFYNMVFKTEGEDTYDGGSFTGLSGVAYITSNSQMTVGTDNIIITGVQVKNTAEETAFDYTSGTKGYVLVLENNPFINPTNYRTVANQVANIVVGTIFRTFDGSTLNNPCWQAGDPCEIVDFRNNHYMSFITNLTFQTGAYEKVSCGALSPTERNTVRYSEAVKTAVAIARSQVDEKLTDYDKIVQNMNSLAMNAMGLRWAEVYDASGNSIFYMSNKPINVSSDKKSVTFTSGSTLWKMTGSGFYVCMNAGTTESSCVWTNGWNTSTGTVVVNSLATIGLTFDWAYGGTLTLGGSNNQNGTLVMKNSSNQIVGGWDNNGIWNGAKDSYGNYTGNNIEISDGKIIGRYQNSYTGDITFRNQARRIDGMIISGVETVELNTPDGGEVSIDRDDVYVRSNEFNIKTNELLVNLRTGQSGRFQFVDNSGALRYLQFEAGWLVDAY